MPEKFDENYAELEQIFKEYKNLPENLIAILQKAQKIYGFLPKEVIYRTAEKLGLSPAKVMGVATFYSQFRLEPVGKYVVMLCSGTACHVNGSEKVAKAVCDYLGTENGGTTSDGIFTLQKVACLGCCSLAPVMMINGKAYGRLTPEKAVLVLKEIREKEAAQ